MKKIFCIVSENKNLKKSREAIEKFRLMEKNKGKFIPAADSSLGLRPGIIDKSDNLEVLTGSIKLIVETFRTSASIMFELPEDLDSNKYSSLSPAEKLFVREKLGISSG